MKRFLLFLMAMSLLLFACSKDRPSQSIGADGTNFISYIETSPTSEIRERVFLEGELGIYDTSTGCWYLLTDEGLLYEPLFCVREPFEQKRGLRLLLYGYFEPDAPQTCAFGPVFYAEQTQVIK